MENTIKNIKTGLSQEAAQQSGIVDALTQQKRVGESRVVELLKKDSTVARLVTALTDEEKVNAETARLAESSAQKARSEAADLTQKVKSADEIAAELVAREAALARLAKSLEGDEAIAKAQQSHVMEDKENAEAALSTLEYEY